MIDRTLVVDRVRVDLVRRAEPDRRDPELAGARDAVRREHPAADLGRASERELAGLDRGAHAGVLRAA